MGREEAAPLVFAVLEVAVRLEVAEELGGAVDRDFFVGESARIAPLELPDEANLRERKFKKSAIRPCRENELAAVAARDADGRCDLEELVAEAAELAQRKRDELRV